MRAHGIKRSIADGEKGDTIVEVLIAIAIASLVITSAYALANRNTRIIQNAQEQTYAQKLVEEQVEQLRAASVKPSTAGCFSSAGVFGTSCTVDNGASYTIVIKPPAAGIYKVEANWTTLTQSDGNISVFYSVGS